MNEQTNNETLFLTAPEVAQRYKISLRQLQRLVSRGDIPQPLKFGGCLRWALQALEEYESDRISESIAVFSDTFERSHTRRK